MAGQHGAEVGAKLPDTLLLTLLVLLHNVVEIFLEGSFPIVGLLDGTILCVLNGGAHSPLPRPAGLHTSFPQKLHKSCFSLSLASIFRAASSDSHWATEATSIISAIIESSLAT